MKILVPLNDWECLQPYTDAGADEFYIGFYDQNWFERFGNFADINRMSGFRKYANKYSFEEMISCASQAHALKKAIFVTLNANCYSQEELDYIEKVYVPQLKAEVDGVIISDCALAQRLKNHGIPTIASTMCAIYNSEIAEIYRRYGVHRIILPRDLTLSEISDIHYSIPDIEIEVFFMRNGCVFSDCYCLGTHCEAKAATCSFLRTSNAKIFSTMRGFDNRHEIELNSYLYNTIFHKQACGMCALYRLIDNGVSALKIVGRADNHEQICKDIALTKRNICLAENCSNEQEYLELMEFPENAYLQCKLGLNCYYPEVRFK